MADSALARVLRQVTFSFAFPATLSLLSCLGDPVGPGGTLVIRRLTVPQDTVLLGAPGRPFAEPIVFEALDADGRPIPGGAVRWSVGGTNGRVNQATAVTDSRGEFSAIWVLGTRASEAQQLTVNVEVGRHDVSETVAAIAKPTEVSSIAFAQETTTVKLGVPTTVVVKATDPFGNAFTPNSARFISLDTTLCSVDSVGVVKALKRGRGRVTVGSGPVSDTTWISAIQVVQAIVAYPDTLRFHSLGQTAPLVVHLLDDQGSRVRDSLPVDSVADTVVVVQPGRPFAVRSVSNGVTRVVLRAGTVAQSVGVVVDQRVAAVKLSAGRTTFDALGDTVQLAAQVLDSLGGPLASEVLSYWSGDSSVARVGAKGLVTSAGNGATWLYSRASNGVTDSLRVSVAQAVARLLVRRDSLLFDALHAILPIQATATDRLGAPVTNASLNYSSADPTVATVDGSGNVRALANGGTVVSAAYGPDTAAVAVRVAQRPVRVLLPKDTVRFVALGETQSLAAIAVDSLGSPVSASLSAVVVADTTVVSKIDSTTVRSHANGLTEVQFSVASLPVRLAVLVQQVPETVLASVQYPAPIVALPVDTLLPLVCTVRDRNGVTIANASPSVTTSQGTVVDATCGALRIKRSGFDTLHVQIGTHTTVVPVLVAVRPVGSSDAGDFLQVDSLPTGTFPWAPTAYLNDHGGTELYFTAYASAPSVPEHILGDLHRLVSNDGVNFTYDGTVLTRDSLQCSLNGSGIENVAIVPRSDAVGWRMFYASGSFGCYGWQVFSAVSVDGRTWQKEPGIRLGNGGVVPPQLPVTAPYPVGEGMEVDRLPSGQYRMIVGTFDHVQPAPNNLWQIGEWRSDDQINWSYLGTVLTTSDLPPAGQGSVYSPTISLIAPGLWRMVFTADARGTVGSRSALWSAVSTDRRTWQVEGRLLGADYTDLYYATMVGNHLFFVRRDIGGSMRLAVATIVMP